MSRAATLPHAHVHAETIKPHDQALGGMDWKGWTIICAVSLIFWTAAALVAA